jgi:hypothetical protein
VIETNTKKVEETPNLNGQTRSNPELNPISNLPHITSLLIPKEYELLPNTSEVFELEFAFYEHKFLTKAESIKRIVFERRIDSAKREKSAITLMT